MSKPPDDPPPPPPSADGPPPPPKLPHVREEPATAKKGSFDPSMLALAGFVLIVTVFLSSRRPSASNARWRLFCQRLGEALREIGLLWFSFSLLDALLHVALAQKIDVPARWWVGAPVVSILLIIIGSRVDAKHAMSDWMPKFEDVLSEGDGEHGTG